MISPDSICLCHLAVRGNHSKQHRKTSVSLRFVNQNTYSILHSSALFNRNFRPYNICFRVDSVSDKLYSFLSILKWCKMSILFKHLIEPLLIRKTNTQCNIADFQASVGQQLLRPVNAHLEEEINWTHARLFLECPCKITGA